MDPWKFGSEWMPGLSFYVDEAGHQSLEGSRVSKYRTCLYVCTVFFGANRIQAKSTALDHLVYIDIMIYIHDNFVFSSLCLNKE